MLMDLSSEMIHSLLPAFLVTVVGASALSVGVIEGIAEATASFGRVFSGALSDRIGARKPLILTGYGLAAITRPLFPLATGAGTVLLARFVDRIGKGIRTAPRDALVADITPAEVRGAAYGLRQSMDTVGAFLGPLVAVGLMAASGDHFRLVFWIAGVPAAVAVLVIIFGVREPVVRTPRPTRWPITRSEIARLDRRFWALAGFAGVLTLARFSEAFLLLRAQDLGLAVRYVPLVLIAMNVAYAASAFPFGFLADRLGPRRLLVLSILFLVAADITLATAGAVWVGMVGAGIWGLHMGASQGVISAMVADRAPNDLRGTAFGMLSLVTGGGLLVASVLAGALWASVGPSATFIAGAGVATGSLLCLALVPHPGD